MPRGFVFGNAPGREALLESFVAFFRAFPDNYTHVENLLENDVSRFEIRETPVLLANFPPVWHVELFRLIQVKFQQSVAYPNRTLQPCDRLDRGQSNHSRVHHSLV
jgi:hypothetical protein